MSDHILQPVIIAGGSGTRLWPLSREQRPKQLIPMVGDGTMLQHTLRRIGGLANTAPVLICNEQHRFLAAEQLRQSGIKGAPILLEPAGRNTAPAIALAALLAVQSGGDPVLLVLAADHVIRDTVAFHRAVRDAGQLAADGHMVTFGIVPNRAETGYGYIQRGAAQGPGWRVARFVEKPDAEHAARYLEAGDYYWNSGMFMFRASRYLQELEKWRPDILAACRQAMAGAVRDLDFIRVDAQAFAACPSESIDYAIMEHTQDAAMIALDAGWSDVGAWDALADVLPCDEAGNCVRGDVLLEGAQDTLVHSSSRLVAAVGVQDLVIVETPDAVLVAHKSKVQDVKRVVQRLKDAGRPEAVEHREVYRPWGSYDAIGQGERYQVKKITVKPGARLSLQMHHHRAEHWVVVRGTARVTKGDQVMMVTENQSTYIPIGEVHCLENPGVIPLELIEVQSGAYLGEDDIVRLQDNYGRA